MNVLLVIGLVLKMMILEELVKYRNLVSAVKLGRRTSVEVVVLVVYTVPLIVGNLAEEGDLVVEGIPVEEDILAVEDTPVVEDVPVVEGGYGGCCCWCG
ncbi:unnamed protein product [[Candida] boidinii]|nr:unnamed protein product [[Candida] boidinii]